MPTNADDENATNAPFAENPDDEQTGAHEDTETAKLRAEIRSSWEFIAACQLLVLFQESFDLESFNTRDFEEQLLKSCDRTVVDNDELIMIHTVNSKNWLEILPNQFEKRKKIEAEWISYRSYIGLQEYISSLDEVGSSLVWTPDLTYNDISIRHKILIIYCLCEWQFDNLDTFYQIVDSDENEASWLWRMRPVGYDSTERFAYWHFHDHRLYKQSIQENSNDETWTLIADKSLEWQKFTESLHDSRNKNDKKLYSYLSGVLSDVIPFLEEFEKEREKKRAYEERVANAKKSYRIRSRELEKLEIQSLDFLQDFSETRRSQRRRVKSPVLSMQERRDIQLKKQKESRSRRALERELKASGLYDDSIFSTEEGNTMSSVQTLERTTASNSRQDILEDDLSQGTDEF